jgi:hypothetical protein
MASQSAPDAMRRSAIRSAVLSIGGITIVIATLAYSYVALQDLQRRAEEMRMEIRSLEGRRAELDADIKTKAAAVNELTRQRELLSATLRELNATLGRIQKDPDQTRKATEAAIVAAANYGVRPQAIPSRVYVQVGSESSRERAKQVTAALQGAGFLVPGIERVSKMPSSPELRYFRQGDKPDADRALAVIGAQVPGLKARLVPGYENSTAIRARHLELWM